MPTKKAPSIRLKPIKEKAALLIAEGAIQVIAADQCQVTEATMSRWCNDPEFQQRVEQLRTDVISQGDERLAESYTDAVETIIKIAKSGGVPGVVASQLRAAMFIIDRNKKRGRTPTDPTKATRTAEVEAELTADEEADELLGRGR